MIPPDLRYTKDHEWISVDGERGRIGITSFAQEQLGDVVFVELPEVGRTFAQGEQFGSIESVKAVSDLYCPVSGEVVEVNAAAAEEPEQVNQDPFGTWLIAVRLHKPEELLSLLDAAGYVEIVK